VPNIPEFEARAADQGLQPQEGGARAFEGEGRHVEAAYARAGNDIGSGINDLGTTWEHHVTVQADLSTLKLQSQKMVSRQQEWRQAFAEDQAAPVHNPNLLQDLQQKWAGEDDAYNATLPTQEAQAFHQEQAIRQRQHFAEVGMADMATLAAHQGVTDVEHTGIYLQSASHNDPTSLTHNLGTIDTSVEAQIRALGPNATAEAIALMREAGDRQKTASTLAAGRGTVDNAVDPVGGAPGSGIGPAATKFLESPEAKLYLSDQQRAEIQGYADRQSHARQQDAWMQEEHAHRQAEWQSQDTMSQYQKILGDSLKPGGSLPGDFLSTVLADPHLRPGDRDTLVGLTHRMQTEAANIQTGPGVLHTLLGRVTLPEGDPHRLTPNEVLQHIGVDLSRTDGDFLLERLKPAAEAHDRMANIMLDQAIREARAALVPHDTLSNLDPAQKALEEHNMSAFETWFVAAYTDGLRQGKTPAQLLSPDSADYLLKGNKIQTFAGQGAGSTPAGGSAAAPLGGTPPKGIVPRQADWADGIANFLGAANSNSAGLDDGQKQQLATWIRGLGDNPLGQIFGGDQSGQRITLSPQVTNEMDRIIRATKAGQGAPPQGTAGNTAVAPPAQQPTLSQQQVDGLLFGKP